MKAVAIENYGGPETLKVMDLPKPSLRDDDVLVEVHAAAINPVDWKIRRGLMKERLQYEFPLVLGWDLAGVVAERGPRVKSLAPGDEVYGRTDVSRNGTYAEYVAVSETLLARKPGNLDFEEAAAMPFTGQTAWQCMVDTAAVHAGQKVLIHGGAGGVGSLAIQIAKVRGAHVASTGSSRNRKYVTRLGVDLYVDYETQDFAKLLADYDVVLDTLGGDVLGKSHAVVKKGGLLMSIAAPPEEAEANRLGIRVAYVIMQPERRKLEELTRLLEAGAIKPLVTKVLALEEVRQGHEMSESHHVRGKLVIKIR